MLLISTELFTNVLYPFMDELLEAEKEQDLKRSYEEVRSAYSIENVKKADPITYVTNSKKCAYLFIYGPSHSTLVIRCLLDFIDGRKMFNTWFSRIIREDNGMQICALGGGPGLETIIAYRCFEAVTQEWNKQNATSDQRKLSSVNLKDIDINRWESVFYSLCQKVEESMAPDCMKFQKEFILADLLDMNKQSEETRKAISNSDFILVVKLLSALSHKETYVLKLQSSLERIMDQMKDGALLFVVDGSNPLNKKVLNDAASACRCMKTVFEQFIDVETSSECFENWKSRYARYFGGDSANPLRGNNAFVQVLQKNKHWTVMVNDRKPSISKRR